MLADACSQCGAEQDGLLDWALRDAYLAVILSDGRKVVFPVVPGAAIGQLAVTNMATEAAARAPANDTNMATEPAAAAAPGVTSNGDSSQPDPQLQQAQPGTKRKKVATKSANLVGQPDTSEIPISEAVATIHRIAERGRGRK